MSRFQESRKFSNEGSTLVEVLARYLERRRRDRAEKGKAGDNTTRPRKAAERSPA